MEDKRVKTVFVVDIRKWKIGDNEIKKHKQINDNNETNNYHTSILLCVRWQIS